MKCPKCGKQLERSKKSPDYLICRSCRKKFRIPPAPKDEQSRSEGTVKKEASKKDTAIGCVTLLVILAIIIFLVRSCGSDDSKKEEAKDDSFFILCAESVLDDYYPSAKYPSISDNSFKVINTDLRYKVKGKVSIDGVSKFQNFWVIMEFSDDTYEEYTIFLAQIGDEVLYEK